jgi:hypothetical protein
MVALRLESLGRLATPAALVLRSGLTAHLCLHGWLGVEEMIVKEPGTWVWLHAVAR